MLYQVQCRVTLDNPLCCTRSNVELHSTALLYQVRRGVTLGSRSVLGPVSSYTGQPFSTRSNVESHSTALSFVPGPLSSSNRHVIWCTIFYVLLSSCDLMAAFEIRILIDFVEKNWARLSELSVTSWTAKWSSCWLSQNLYAERGNEECRILPLRSQSNTRWHNVGRSVGRMFVTEFSLILKGNNVVRRHMCKTATYIIQYVACLEINTA